MPKFFIENIGPKDPSITGEDARHIIRSLRMRVGETLLLCDTRGTDYTCEITGIEGETVRLRVLSRQKNHTEPSVEITLFQCLPKGDKFEDILKRAVELGVTEIVPVLSEHSVSRPDEKVFIKKRARYQKIAKEAAMQSGRGLIPRVADLLKIPDAFSLAPSYDKMILFYEGQAQPVAEIVSGNEARLALIIGPEGGFSQPEVEAAREAGVFTATLGKRILRCETAPIAALTLVYHLTGNMQ